MPDLQANLQTDSPDKLYQFRLERSGQTKLAGLLAIRHQADGVWGGLLDATGIPLVKLLVTPAGNNEIEYCAATVCDTKLPEVIGKLIHSIYFRPADPECPWYTVSCVCAQSAGDKKVKWNKTGPFRSWEITMEKPGTIEEKIAMKMYFSSVLVQLQRNATTLQK
jgi:hypothetical protein